MESMSLVKYSEYNRKEVHDLFVPGEEYKPWAGVGFIRSCTSANERIRLCFLCDVWDRDKRSSLRRRDHS